jgi:hypothetical protein
MLNKPLCLAAGFPAVWFAALKEKKRRRSKAACFYPVFFGSPEKLGEAMAKLAKQ